MYKFHLKLLVLSVSAGLCAQAGADTRPAVLELFTSEGCSSCPPAEMLVNELAQRRDVLPLSFHVDYWDGLGWRDPFSLASATERQRQYARALHLSSVYTPQVVVDGSRDLVGSERTAVTHAVAAQRTGVLTAITVANGEARVVVGAGAAASADVLLVGYRRQVISHIGRGENSGRTLTESNIVRALQVLGPWSGESREFRVMLTSLPADVTDVAVLLQSTGQGSILGAVSQPIR